MSKINQALLKEYLELQYPIGKTEFFLDNEDHSNYMGFTWQLDSKGRVPVGLDTSDTDFNVIGKTGGSKELQAHSHDVKINNQGGSASGLSFNWTYNNDGVKFYDGTAFLKETGTGNSGNLQPYKVFAIWVRIA